MKYMLLIYGNEELWSSFPQDDIEQVDRARPRRSTPSSRER